jgi:hypothetical protein
MSAKKIIQSLVFSFLIFTMGCDSSLFGGDDPIKIRIENSTEFEMEDIIVSFPKDEITYGDLAPGAQTEFIEIKKAYRYAYIESEINGGKAYLVPIDYVGEKPLESGRYTYRLYVASDNSDQQDETTRYNLGIELKKN